MKMSVVPFSLLAWVALCFTDVSVQAAQPANVHINEFVSENLPRVNDPSAPVDMDGDYPDWIEIKNDESFPVNLAGYSLSDDPAMLTKWTFANTTVPAGGYVVVFASKKNRAINNVQPHTNFKLSSPGQIILSRPDDMGGSIIVHSIIYPAQRQTVSYGFENNNTNDALKFLTTPTPGTGNNAASAVTNFVKDTRFDVDRGLYSDPITVHITSATPGATIAYTMNGSVPSPGNGIQVPAPDAMTAPTASVSVARTTLLRARSYKAGMGPSDVDTQSYLFLDDVMTQNGPPPSMNLRPADTLSWGTSGGNLANLTAFPGLTFFGVNQAIATDSDPDNRFTTDDLKSVPIVSIVMDWRQLFGTNLTGQTDGGIYPPASGVAIEGIDRAASMEFINPSGDLVNPNAEKGFQVDGNVHIFGGTSQDRWKSYKLSMRFQCSQGVNYKVYGSAGAEQFSNFVLDARINNTWNHPDAAVQGARGDYVNDQVVADLQNAVSGRGGFHNRPVQLFLNGLYWGLFSLHEKPDHHFAAAYYGGDSDDWDVFKHSVSPDFSESDPLVNTLPLNASNAISRANATVVNNYETMLDRVGVGYVAPNPVPDLTQETNYAAVVALLDIDDFIDYMIVNFLAGNWDWSDKNLYAAYYRGPGGKWHFYSWDSEHTFRTGTENFLTGNGNETPHLGQPKGIHNRLKVNAEYRLKFADHLRRHMFNDGALTVAGLSNAFNNRFAEIDSAIRGESARWGHIRASVRPSPFGNVPFKRSDWLRRKNQLLVSETGSGSSLLQNRWNLLMAPPPAQGSFRTENLYPSVSAPDFNQFGGAVPAGFNLIVSHTNASGVIYFTTDGSDPRTYGTSAVAPTAQAYSVPLTLNTTTHLRARVLSGGQWSAMTEAIFYPPQDLSNLVLTEIMYNPPSFAGIAGDEFEYLELKNVGTNTLDLTGLAFTTGISFNFPNGTLLAPGQHFLLVRNAAAFALKYPGLTPDGVYTGKLDNNGETLKITHNTLGTTALSCTYNDQSPWPVAPDNFDFSLVLKDPDSRPDLNVGSNWRASTLPGGSPGTDDPASTIPPILINEVLSHSETTNDFIELFNPTANSVNVGGWFLSDNPGVPTKYRIPDGTLIAPMAYAVFVETNFNPTPGTNNSFSLNAHGDDVYLFSGDANTNLTGYSHGFTFGAAADGETFGRYVNSVGEEQFPAQLTPTPGQPNSGPRVGPVVINEIMYHPDASGDAFIELKSISTNSIPLYDPLVPTNTWRLNGLGYAFPTNLLLGSNELILVVATNPAAFRAKYGVPANVAILGPYPGVLQHSGERLALQRPDVPDTNGLAYITVDEVRYNDKAPWPPAADGSGPSLQRKNSVAYGNDPANWTAARATPGAEFPGGDTPTILMQPQNQIAVAGSNVIFNVGATGTPPLQFSWRFNGHALPGATNAILLLSNAQPDQAGVYSVDIFNGAGAIASAQATLTVLSPVAFTLQPQSQNVLPGSDVTLSALAVGNGMLHYQWRFEGVDIPGATNSSYSFTNASVPEQHGNFSVVVTDDISTAVSSNALIFVLIKPGIVMQPVGTTNLQWQTATFSVIATGAPPLSYRWIRQGLNFLSNAPPVLVITNLQPNIAGSFRVVVTNLAGSFNSVTVNLGVIADTDADGLPDFWEMNFVGDPTNMSATADTDGDGMINRDEYLAGTNPTDVLSVLKLTVTTANSAELQFVAQTNTGYTLQYRTNLTSALWNNVTSIAAQSLMQTVRVSVPKPPPEPARFYRVVTPKIP